MRLPLLALLLASCSTQAVIRPNGDKLINTNFLSAGTMTISPDGNMLMSGTAEKAGDNLGKYGAQILNTAILNGGIGAIKDIANNALKK